MAKAMRLAAAVLCAIVLCASMAAPAVASRKMSGEMVSAAIRAFCIPTTESLLTAHEGRHECVYSLTNGHKAVGVGYDLDDDKDTRRSELSTVLADYDKVRWLCPASTLMNGKRLFSYDFAPLDRSP